MNVSTISSTERSGIWRSSAALLALAALTTMSSAANARVFISVGFAPPPLPVYVQPVIPAPGYIWTPGYWAYADNGGYYWVPGTWVFAPFAGALWTPGYWGWAGGVYVFHSGYWGRHVGFYGGINYGYGYTGVGYAGGYWRGNGFYYNRAVNQIGGNVTNVYNHTVINNFGNNRTSFNGGQGGIAARPTPQDAVAAREAHVAPVAAQQQQVSMASHNQALRATFNHGAPPIAATARPGAFAGQGVVPARAAGTAFSPQAAGAHTQRLAGVNSAPIGGNPALRSASFAPHMSVPNFTQHATTAGAAAVPRGSFNGHAATSHATYTPQTRTYRAQSTAYHPQTQAHQTAYHPAAVRTAARAPAAHSRAAAPRNPERH